MSKWSGSAKKKTQDDAEFDKLTQDRGRVDHNADERLPSRPEASHLASQSCAATTISALGTELTRLALLAGLLAVEFASAAAESDESLFHGLQGGRKITGILLMAMALVASSMACALLAILPPTKECRNTVLARFFVLFIVMSLVEILCLFILVGMSCDETATDGSALWACSRAPTILALGIPIQLPTVGGRIVVLMSAWNVQSSEDDLGPDVADSSGKHGESESLMQDASSSKHGAGTGLRQRSKTAPDEMLEDDDEWSDGGAESGSKKQAQALDITKTSEELGLVSSHHHVYQQIEEVRKNSDSVHTEVRRLHSLLDAQIQYRKSLEKRMAIAEQRGMNSGDFERIHRDINGKLEAHAEKHRSYLDQVTQKLQEFSGMAQTVGLSKAEAGTKKLREQLAEAIAMPEKQIGDAKKFALSLLGQASEMASILCAIDQKENESKDIRRLRAKYQSARHLRDLVTAAIETRVREVLDPSARQGREMVAHALMKGAGGAADIKAASDSEQRRAHPQQGALLPQAHSFHSHGPSVVPPNSGVLPQAHSFHSPSVVPPNSGERVARNLFADHATPPRARSLDDVAHRFASHMQQPFLHQQNSIFHRSPPRMMPPPPPTMSPSPLSLGTSPLASPSAFGHGMQGGGHHLVHAPFFSPQTRM